eukprot:3939224-Rhodomonas_salina.1
MICVRSDALAARPFGVTSSVRVPLDPAGTILRLLHGPAFPHSAAELHARATRLHVPLHT